MSARRGARANGGRRRRDRLTPDNLRSGAWPAGTRRGEDARVRSAFLAREGSGLWNAGCSAIGVDQVAEQGARGGSQVLQRVRTDRRFALERVLDGACEQVG